MQSLNAKLLKSSAYKDLLYFGARWFLIIGLAITVFAFRQFNFDAISDILTAVAISAVANIVLLIFAWFQPLHAYSPLVALVTDWITIGVFVRVVGVNNLPFELVSILAIAITVGFLRHRSMMGVVSTTGIIISAVVAMVTLFGSEWLTQALDIYLPTVIVLVVLSAILSIWLYFQDAVQEQLLVQERKESEEQANTLAHMRESTHALSEMAMELNSTLQYNRILDAALSIGRISMQASGRNRLASVVLLYSYDNRLEIANSQGISHVDENRMFDGKDGIIAQALAETRPVFGSAARNDPEVRSMISFQNVRSMLCIPLRSGFDNYGVLLFGSEARNAFNEDQVESLRIIGTQATIALQNAVLYQGLMEEKERIIELQEDARKDLVRDLHDIPTQTIAAVAMRLGIIPKMLERDPDNVPDEIETIRNMTLRATEEIRHVLFKLRPLVLESRGLNAALQQLSNKMEQTYRQPMQTYVEQQVEHLLDVQQQGAIFHLIEEAANNARKYAEAELIRASVTIQEDSIVVRIADNGNGFDVESVTGGYDQRGSFGMVNMRERAELLDGVLDLKSVPGKGTQITAFIPVPHSRPTSKSIDDTISRIPRSKLSLDALEKK